MVTLDAISRSGVFGLGVVSYKVFMRIEELLITVSYSSSHVTEVDACMLSL